MHACVYVYERARVHSFSRKLIQQFVKNVLEF